jgi:hypothetical protein
LPGPLDRGRVPQAPPLSGVRARNHVWFFPCREAPPCGREASHLPNCFDKTPIFNIINCFVFCLLRHCRKGVVICESEIQIL